MEWEPLGFSDNPLDTDPIKQKTRALYVGHDEKVRICSKVRRGSNQGNTLSSPPHNN